MRGVILAAGKGTRLEPLTFSIPKEMIQIGGKPLIYHSVELFRKGGVDNIVVIVGNKKGAIIDYLRDGKWMGVDISYRFQQELNGVAKGVYVSRPLIDSTFAVTFGDEIIEPKENLIKEMVKLHKERGSRCTIGLASVKDPERYGIVKIDRDGRVLDLMEKPQKREDQERLRTGNSYLGIIGVYIFEPEIFKFIEKTKPGAKGEYQITDSIRLMLKSGLPCFAVVHRGLYRDVGTLEALVETEREILNRG